MDTAYKVAYIAVFGTVKVLSYTFGSTETEQTKTETPTSCNVTKNPENSKSLPPKQTIPISRKPSTCEKINYYLPSRKHSNRNNSISRRRSTGCLRTLQTIPETEAVFNFQSRPRAQSLPENVSRRRILRVSKSSRESKVWQTNKSSSQTKRCLTIS